MPVDTEHPDYVAARTTWVEHRDAYLGELAVKSRGTTYLPKSSSMPQEFYDKHYKFRAKWFGATRKLVDAATAAAFHKPPAIDVSDDVKAHFDDITLTGMSLDTFLEGHFREKLHMGRAAVAVDRNESQSENRPNWILYRPEEITNWRSAIVFRAKNR